MSTKVNNLSCDRLFQQTMKTRRSPFSVKVVVPCPEIYFQLIALNCEILSRPKRSGYYYEMLIEWVWLWLLRRQSQTSCRCLPLWYGWDDNKMSWCFYYLWCRFEKCQEERTKETTLAFRVRRCRCDAIGSQPTRWHMIGFDINQLWYLESCMIDALSETLYSLHRRTL